MPFNATTYWLRLLACAAVLAGAASAHAADMADLWTLRPYAINVVVVADTTNASSEAVSATVARHLETRAASVVGPLWKLTLTLPAGAERLAVKQAISTRDIRQLRPFSEQEPSEDEPAADGDGDEEPSVAFEPAIGKGYEKLILLRVEENSLGISVSGVEYDMYLRRLGPTKKQMVATGSSTPEAAFRLACKLFSPVALFTINRDDYHYATLVFRGSELPAPDASPNWFDEGDVFLPMLRRSDRDGNVPPQGVRAAPWTLLQLNEASPTTATAKVVSHTRRPFGARQRGRVEQLAIRLSLSSDTTRLRLHARDDPDRPLAGYHVYARDTAEGELHALGASNERGLVDIPRSQESAIRTLYVKSGSKLVAKLPIAPGTEDQLETPLVDESKRIEAEARLSLLREELIDLVARRNILIARTKTAIKGKDFKNARALVSELEALPGLNVFNQRLTQAEQLSQARDPAVQARIAKLFEDTRAVLGAFLSSREITQLRREVSDADKQASR